MRNESRESLAQIIDWGPTLLDFFGCEPTPDMTGRSLRGVIESDAPAQAVAELERTLRLNEDVLRYMSIREDELSSGPSVILGGGKDRDRDETDTQQEAA